MDASRAREAVLAARELSQARLRDPRRSPYAVIARCELPPGGEVVLAELPGRVLVQEREGGFLVDGVRQGPGDFVERGRYVLKLSHQNFPAVLVLDTEAALVREGPPLRFFDYDPAFRVAGRLVADGAPRELVVQSTMGHQRRALRLGFVEAAPAGQPVRLLALRLLEPGIDESALSIFFRDATSGRESYGVGRYLDPEALPGGDGAWLLDFNRAYNPLCAYSPHFNCPIPPRENGLAVAIRAGERDPHPP